MTYSDGHDTVNSKTTMSKESKMNLLKLTVHLLTTDRNVFKQISSERVGQRERGREGETESGTFRIHL